MASLSRKRKWAELHRGAFHHGNHCSSPELVLRDSHANLMWKEGPKARKYNKDEEGDEEEERKRRMERMIRK